MQTKQELQKRLDEINGQFSVLREEAIKIVGKIELLVEQEQDKEVKETPK